MMRTGKLLGVAVLSGLVTCSALRADAAPNDPKGPTDRELLEQLARDMRDVRRDIDAMRSLTEAKLRANELELRILNDRIAQLEERLHKQEEAVKSTNDRVSRAFNPQTPVPVPGATGTIRLQNLQGLPATVILNGRTYPVAGFQTVNIAGQPVGAFTYEVLVSPFGSLRPPRTQTLNSNETFTVFITPPGQ
jgi:hypothetical protein